MTFFLLFSTYALAFWYGSVLINQGEISAGRILTVFFGTVDPLHAHAADKVRR